MRAEEEAALGIKRSLKSKKNKSNKTYMLRLLRNESKKSAKIKIKDD